MHKSTLLWIFEYATDNKGHFLGEEFGKDESITDLFQKNQLSINTQIWFSTQHFGIERGTNWLHLFWFAKSSKRWGQVSKWKLSDEHLIQAVRSCFCSCFINDQGKWWKLESVQKLNKGLGLLIATFDKELNWITVYTRV